MVAAATAPALGARPAVRAKNVTSDRGVRSEPTMTYGSAWVDFDHDGDVDVFIDRHWSPPWLFQAKGDSYRRVDADFVDMPGYSGPTPGQVDRHQCAWGEANGKRPADLYCTVGAQSGSGRGPNQLIVRSENGWVNRAEEMGVSDPYGRGRAVNWVDYDTDGDLDIFLANGRRSGWPNLLLRNDRGRFKRIDVGLETEIKSLTSAWIDFDSDDDLDVFLTRGGITGCCSRRPVAYEHHRNRFVRVKLGRISGRAWTSSAWEDFDGDGSIDVALVARRRLVIFRNNRSRFAPVETRKLAYGHGAVWLDWDNDGDMDLFLVQGATGKVGSDTNRPDLLFLQKRDGFRVVEKHPLRGPSEGNGETATVADFDRDGRLDLLVTNGNDPWTWEGPTRLLRNRSASGNWAALDLNGGRWNPFGIGARIEVTTSSGDTYRRFVSDGTGYKSQSHVGYVHLGLADAHAAQVIVRWPGGRRDCVTVVEGRIRSLRRGGSPCS